MEHSKHNIMPAAFCNTCSSIVPLKGKNIKKATCECGSSDLSAVAGKWNDEKRGWDYFDRKGVHRLFVPVDKMQD